MKLYYSGLELLANVSYCESLVTCKSFSFTKMLCVIRENNKALKKDNF